MKTRVVHCKRSKFDIYIGRPSRWGNVYSHKEGTKAQFKTATVDEAIQNYIKWIENQPELLMDLHELKGKILGCWCASKDELTSEDRPYICHGQVLAELADSIND